MFQNITGNDKHEEFEDAKMNNSDRTGRLKGLFSIGHIIIYAISCMVSMVSFNGELAPFGLAMFAAVCSNRIAAGIVYISCLIGTLIGFGGNNVLMYILTTLVFIVATLIFRPKEQDESRNEKQKLGLHLFIAILGVQAIKMFFSIFLIYDLLSSTMLAITAYIFYKIFANSLIVIKEYGIKQAFSIEEIIGASMMLSIAVASLSRLDIIGFSITNILSIMIVLFLGWKNGILVGGTSGITIGMVLGLITQPNPTIIASFAISRNASSEC